VFWKEMKSKVLTLASPNSKVLRIATGIEAFALTLCICLDCAELEAYSASSAITTEVFADI